jgi:hypothetical protein
MKTLHAILLLLLLTSAAHAQDALYTDPRDSRTYPIVTLGGLDWFRADLAFETSQSWCAQHGKDRNAAMGTSIITLTSTAPARQAGEYLRGRIGLPVN